MQIVEVIEGPDKGYFMIQKKDSKGRWKTVSQHPTKLGAEIEYRQKMNLIVDNRLVNDQTFAIRFKHFLEKIQPCDACAEEELEYLNLVANKLLQYQKLTVIPGSNEECYLKNCKVL